MTDKEKIVALRERYKLLKEKAETLNKEKQGLERLLIAADYIMTGDNTDPDCKASLIERIRAAVA